MGSLQENLCSICALIFSPEVFYIIMKDLPLSLLLSPQ